MLPMRCIRWDCSGAERQDVASRLHTVRVHALRCLLLRNVIECVRPHVRSFIR